MDSEIDSPSPEGNEHKDMSHGTDLTTGSVVTRLIRFAIPMLIGSAFHTAYMIINALWVGNGLGANAMAAITVSFPIFFLLMAVAGGLTLASNVLVSQAFGAKDRERLKLVVQNSLVLTGILGVACVLTGHLAAERILRLMQTPPDILPMAASYLRLLLLGTPFMFGVFYQAAVMRGVGDSKTPLYFQAGSLLVTAVLDPLLMFGWLHFPKLGLNGTAVATLIAQVCAFASIAAYVQWREHLVAPDWRRLRIDLPITWLTLKIGVPSMIQQALVSIGMLFIVGMVNRFGEHSTAAFGIAMRIDQLAFMPAMAIGMAVSTLSGQNIGAQRFDRVNEVFRWGVIVSCGLTAVPSVVALALSQQLIGLFTRDADVVMVGSHYLRVVAVGYLFFAVMFTANGVINGSGHTLATTLFTLITFWVVRVPLGAFLSSRMDRVDGIWYAVFASLAVGATLSVGYYASGWWKKPVARHGPSASAPPPTEIPAADL